MTNKIFRYLILLSVASLLLASCSDWNDVENIDIKQPIGSDHDKYLENLRSYKNSDHKYVYAWFDNSVKATSSRGQHMIDTPDSVDVVVLMYPDALADFEIQEIESLQNNKGTKVLYSVSFDVIQKAYNQMVKDETAIDGNYVAPEFLTYMKENVQRLLKPSTTYNYNGIIASYKGLSMVYMTDEEKIMYEANQKAFLSEIANWYQKNTDKTLVFEGSPQFLIDKTLLTSCKHIILNTMNVSSAFQLSVNASEAIDTNIPTDRFIVIASTTSLDPSDKKPGYYGDDLAIIEAAYWVTETEKKYKKAGLAIYNIQNDYYNSTNIYQYARKSINIMNPAPTK